MRILVGMMPMEVTPHLAMPVRVSRTELASNALQGARHAVLTTLYSRAHRIGLDGASCLLDDLRKSSSFNFFVVVVICVSLRPVLEVAILVEQKLQGFGDHVGRRGVDKFSIELKLSLTDSSTRAWTVTAFGCFGGAFRIDNDLLLSCFYKMSDILSDKFLGPRMRPRKTSTGSTCEGGSDPRNFWAARPQKSGVAPAQFALFCAVSFAGAVVAKL